MNMDDITVTCVRIFLFLNLNETTSSLDTISWLGNRSTYVEVGMSEFKL
jgi:hypothetical protein